MRWIAHLSLSASVATAASIAIEPVAIGADCSSPTIEYIAGVVDRGDPITLRGTAWGEDCYDTGPPPPGQGTLGVPIRRIVITIVQADNELVVARGSADADYTFDVTFPLPSQLEPGEARIVAVAESQFVVDATDEPLLVTENEAPGAGRGVAVFGVSPIRGLTGRGPVIVAMATALAAGLIVAR